MDDATVKFIKGMIITDIKCYGHADYAEGYNDAINEILTLLVEDDNG